MKSSADLGQRLAKQWQQATLRAERLLSAAAWPVMLPIGKPTAQDFSERTCTVQQHVQAWQQVSVGEVQWQAVNFRAGAEPVNLPVRWCLRKPSEWIDAAADASVAQEYALLEQLVTQVDELFHLLFIRQRSLWLKTPLDEVIQTAHLAVRLSPGCAEGRPLRLLAGHGVDTKFIERNGRLLTRLLDERFDGAPSEQGLINFLGALDEGDHWILLAPLSEGLLPFKRLKITTTELAQMHLPGSRILVVENERCLHLLPELPDTLAILGAGLNLQWLASKHWIKKSVGYWGDMDTWGLVMLARARACCPTLTPLLMTRALFEQYAAGNAVPEPVTAQPEPPEGLTGEEAGFYRYLLRQEQGRLEQEYLPKDEVEKAVVEWAAVAGVYSHRV